MFSVRVGGRETDAEWMRSATEQESEDSSSRGSRVTPGGAKLAALEEGGKGSNWFGLSDQVFSERNLTAAVPPLRSASQSRT